MDSAYGDRGTDDSSGNGVRREDNTPVTDSAKPAAAATTLSPHAPTDRKYLLERVDDAAVAQLYADGFASLRWTRSFLSALVRCGARGPRYLLRPALRAQLEMREVWKRSSRTRWCRFAHADRDPALYEAVLAQYRAHNNLTARKFVLKCALRTLRGGARGRERRRDFSAEERRNARRDAGQTSAALLRSVGRPDVTNKTPGPGKDILTSSANNLYVGVS